MSQIKSKSYFQQRLVNIESIINLMIASCIAVVVGSISWGIATYNNLLGFYYFLFPKEQETISPISYRSNNNYDWALWLALIFIAGLLAYVIFVVIYQFMFYSFMKEFYPTFNRDIQGLWSLWIPILGPFFAYFCYKELILEVKKHTGDIDNDDDYIRLSIFSFTELKVTLGLIIMVVILNPALLLVGMPMSFHIKIEQQYFESVALLYTIAWVAAYVSIVITPTSYFYSFNKRIRQVFMAKIAHDESIPAVPIKQLVSDVATNDGNKNVYAENLKNAILNIKQDDSEFITKLEKLEELYKRGAITEEEFTKAKSKILDSDS